MWEEVIWGTEGNCWHGLVCIKKDGLVGVQSINNAGKELLSLVLNENSKW